MKEQNILRWLRKMLKKKLGKKFRNLLNIPIDYALINILVNNLLYFRTGTLPEIYYFIDKYFFRKGLNMISSLRGKVTAKNIIIL